MKILSINSNISNSLKFQTTYKETLSFKANVDTISFRSKTPEHILLEQEAKVLSKEAYSVYAKGKNTWIAKINCKIKTACIKRFFCFILVSFYGEKQIMMVHFGLLIMD